MNDLKFAFRQFLKNPGFTTVAVLSLAIGIGSCTALFSIVNGVLLRPLPFPDPEYIVSISETVPPNGQVWEVAPATYLDWVKQASVFTRLAALRGVSHTTKLDGRSVRIDGTAVTAGFFTVLGVQLILGRGFLPEEELPGKNHVAILSYRAWRDQFGGRDDVINRTIVLDDQSYVIVGVLPDTNLVWNSALYTPLAFSAADRSDYGSHMLRCIGRMKPGTTKAQAQAEMKLISDYIAREHPDSSLGRGGHVEVLLDFLTGGVRLQLLVLLCAVGLLLLIACVNVAGMLLARANTRLKEMAVRSALGATRAQIMRLLLSESLLIAAGGGVLGVLAAYMAMGALSQFSGRFVPRTQDISLDGSVLCVTAGLVLIAGFGVGLVPAFQFSRGDVAEPLKDSGRGSSSGRSRQYLRALLVTTEIALAMMLLVGTGLLARSLVALQETDLGYETGGIHISRLSLSGKRYDAPQSIMTAVRSPTTTNGAD